MPLTQEQMDTIRTLLNGTVDDHGNSLNGKITVCTKVRDQLVGLMDELHEGFADNAELMAVVTVARQRAKVAAEELVVLLS